MKNHFGTFVFIYELSRHPKEKKQKKVAEATLSAYKLQKEFIELNVMPKKPKIVNTALMNDMVPTTNLQVLPL